MVTQMNFMWNPAHVEHRFYRKPLKSKFDKRKYVDTFKTFVNQHQSVQPRMKTSNTLSLRAALSAPTEQLAPSGVVWGFDTTLLQPPVLILYYFFIHYSN